MDPFARRSISTLSLELRRLQLAQEKSRFPVREYAAHSLNSAAVQIKNRSPTIGFSGNYAQ